MPKKHWEPSLGHLEFLPAHKHIFQNSLCEFVCWCACACAKKSTSHTPPQWSQDLLHKLPKQTSARYGTMVFWVFFYCKQVNGGSSQSLHSFSGLYTQLQNSGLILEEKKKVHPSKEGHILLDHPSNWTAAKRKSPSMTWEWSGDRNQGSSVSGHSRTRGAKINLLLSSPLLCVVSVHLARFKWFLLSGRKPLEEDWENMQRQKHLIKLGGWKMWDAWEKRKENTAVSHRPSQDNNCPCYRWSSADSTPTHFKHSHSVTKSASFPTAPFPRRLVFNNPSDCVILHKFLSRAAQFP